MVETGSGQANNPAQRFGEADEQPHGVMQCPVGLYSGCSRLTHGIEVRFAHSPIC